MPRSSLSLPVSKPLYREVLKQALDSAWYDRRYWILALLAGILMSAGSVDIIRRTFLGLTAEPSFLFLIPGMTLVQRLVSSSSSGLEYILSIIGGMEALLFIALIVLTVAAISCMAQGGLVYALNSRKKDSPKAGEALRIGSLGLWPIIVLNIFSLGIVWALRILIHLPAAFDHYPDTVFSYTLYVIASVIFVLVSFFIAIIHIFALNGMILQGATLREALARGCILFKKHWLIVVETCVIQAIISIGIWFAFAILFLIAMIPIFVLIVTAAMLQSTAIFSISLLVGTLIFLVAAICVGGFTIQFQYATWTNVYRRLGEGGVLPKIHRVIRNLLGVHVVPE